MNDLISRKELLDRLRGNVLVDVTLELEKAIEDQPTAFDVEKVVSELQEAKELDVYVPLEDALEIIRKGGIEEE